MYCVSLLCLIAFAVGNWEGAIVELEKMAKLVAYLSSDDADFINGGEYMSSSSPLRESDANATACSHRHRRRWHNGQLRAGAVERRWIEDTHAVWAAVESSRFRAGTLGPDDPGRHAMLAVVLVQCLSLVL